MRWRYVYKSINLYVLKIKTGIFMSRTEKPIDMVILYRILRIIRENDGVISVTELFNTYRERYKIKISYELIKRHVDYAVEKKLIEKHGIRPSRLKITRTGLDYLWLLSQIERLLDEHFS